MVFFISGTLLREVNLICKFMLTHDITITSDSLRKLEAFISSETADTHLLMCNNF